MTERPPEHPDDFQDYDDRRDPWAVKDVLAEIREALSASWIEEGQVAEEEAKENPIATDDPELAAALQRLRALLDPLTRPASVSDEELKSAEDEVHRLQAKNKDPEQ